MFLDGTREGIVETILEETGERVVAWDTGLRETLLPGYLQLIPGGVKLSA